MTPLKQSIVNLEAPTSHLSVSHFLQGPHMKTVPASQPINLPTFSCPVCNHNVPTGDSVQLADGNFCHHRCRKFIFRSGQLKPLIKPEGSRPPTPKQRESNIKSARRSIQTQGARAILRKEAATLPNNSLPDYLKE